MNMAILTAPEAAVGAPGLVPARPRRPRSAGRAWRLAAALLLGSLALAEDEVQFTGEQFKMLDTNEAQALARADKVFAQKDYRRAVAEYESFILEFGKSRAVPYALLRKGRSLEVNSKRHEAIRTYKEVLDYFPNESAYAAPALYFTGLCHMENGDTEKAVVAWTELGADPDYRKHPLAAQALNAVADEWAKRGQEEKAQPLYEQIALDFRNENAGAAHYAIGRAAGFYARRMNEPGLRLLYGKVKTFAARPQAPGADPAQDRTYWDCVRDLVRRNGRFEIQREDARREYHKYWSGQMAGKFPDWDEFQLDWAEFGLVADKNVNEWVARLDRQFERGYKPGDFARVMRWMRLLSAHRSKVQEYYHKINFEQLRNPQIEEVMRFFYDELKDADLGRNTFQKLRRHQFDDQDKARLARYFFSRDEGLVKDLCADMQDRNFAKFVLMEFYCATKDTEKALALAEELTSVPQYAKEALRRKGEIYEQLKQFDKAIPVWRQMDEPPGTLYRIADCYRQMGKVDEAVGQLREIENFFKDQSSSAAYKIARLFHDAGQRPRYVAQLRYVMKSYPRSKESSQAHQELEKLGVKIGGGVDAEP